MNDADREKIILDAIAKATKKIKLVNNSWGIEFSDKKEQWVPKKSYECCALSCVILEYQFSLERVIDFREWTIKTILDCNQDWIDAFRLGFDGHPKYNELELFAYDLGCHLKEKLIPKTLFRSA